MDANDPDMDPKQCLTISPWAEMKYQKYCPGKVMINNPREK
jgi:hypothetical protein